MSNLDSRAEPQSATSRLLLARRESTFAAQQIERSLGRIFSLALVLSAGETVINAVEQIQYLNSIWFWLTLSAVVVSVVGMVLSHWFFSASNLWYILHFGAVAFALLTWPLQVKDPALLPYNFTPWVWWQLGISTMSAGFGLGLAFAAVFVVGTPIYFIFLHMSPSGGSAEVLPAVQDAVYSFLFSATFISVVHLLRLRARQQDEANTRAQEQAVAEATQEAIENERLYLASMLHDQVLGALHLAATATNKAQQLQAKQYAQAAMEQLKTTQEWPSAEERRVSTDSLFNALTKTLAEQAPNFTVSTSSVGILELPLDVATAFTEATMQAVNNSQMHAGGPKVARHVSLKSGKGGVKIVVSDEGRGFRMSRVPKSRIGIKTLIIRRMESVGGKARIDSDRGQGANIILEWHANG